MKKKVVYKQPRKIKLISQNAATAMYTSIKSRHDQIRIAWDYFPLEILLFLVILYDLSRHFDLLEHINK